MMVYTFLLLVAIGAALVGLAFKAYGGKSPFWVNVPMIAITVAACVTASSIVLAIKKWLTVGELITIVVLSGLWIAVIFGICMAIVAHNNKRKD